VSETGSHLTYMIDIALNTEVFARRWRCPMNGADRVIRWSTAFAVLGVAAVAASYEHARRKTPVPALAVAPRLGYRDLCG
jgi:hypothetical protein